MELKEAFKSALPEGQIFLLTGATGFVGSELLSQLLALGVKTRVLVRDPRKISKTYHSAIESGVLQIAVGDLRDARSLQSAMHDIYGVFHLGAVYRQTNLRDAEFYDINAEGTRRLLQAGVAAQVKRFVHCSTVGVHADVKGDAADETVPYEPNDVYQRSKVEAEKIALEYMRSGKIGGVVIRPAMIYGPRDTRFLKLFRAIAMRYFMFLGDGEQLVHFIDVRDLARAFILAMQRSDLNGEVFIIAGERSLRFMDFVALIAMATGHSAPRWHLPLGPLFALAAICEFLCKPLKLSPPLYKRRVEFFRKGRAFNTSKARQMLGFAPARTVEAEVVELVDWYRAQGWI